MEQKQEAEASAAEPAKTETMDEHEEGPPMEDEAGVEKEQENRSKSMTPWEQHSAVISIPRFDYNAPSSLLQHSHSGFLITCTIKREKSATKEAISILHKYIGLISSDYKVVDSPDNLSKRRKVPSENIDEKVSDSKDNGEVGNLNCSSSAKAEVKIDGIPGLSLVKLTRSGLLLFTFPRNVSPDTVRIVSDIIHFQESGKSSLPVWCHRIFPIQATCCLDEKELKIVVSKLVENFVHDKRSQLGSPVKFAVGYNRRGTEDTKLKTHIDTSNGSNASELLDRNKCFAVVAAAVKGVVVDAVVDLYSPEFSVLVELLPLSGVPNNSLVVAVSVLPRYLVSTKPRLCVRTLVTGAKK